MQKFHQYLVPTHFLFCLSEFTTHTHQNVTPVPVVYRGWYLSGCPFIHNATFVFEKLTFCGNTICWLSSWFIDQMEHPSVTDRCLWVCTSPTDVTHHVTLKTRRRNLLPHLHPPLFLYQLLHSLSWLVAFNFEACCHYLVIQN